jgi:hypothetical protein
MTPLKNAFFVCLIAAVAASAATDPALLGLLMPDATVVSGIHVDNSKASRFGRYVLSQMQADDPGFRKFVADTGFDPRRDLSEIVLATSGKGDTQRILVVGKGVFNPGAITNTARNAGAELVTYKGFDLLMHQQGNMPGAIAFLDAGTAVMGHVDAVKAAIDRSQAGETGLPAAVMTKVQELSAANDAWFMTTGPVTSFFDGKMADPNLDTAMKGNLLQAVLQANGGVKFGTDTVRISGEALTRSDKDASALADVIRFIAGLVQLNKDKDPQAQKIATLLDTLQLTTEASTMKVSLTIPENLIEQLFVPKAKGAARPRKTASVR